MRKRLPILIACLLTAAVACGKKQEMKAAATRSAAPLTEPAAAKADEAKPADAPPSPGQPSFRKIIVNGTLGVEVDDYPAARGAIDALVAQLGGHMGASDVAHGERDAVVATIVLRIPASRFDEAVKRLSALGRVTQEQTRAEDVSEDYTDLNARLANSRRLEERLLTLLDKQAGSVSDVLTVEQELARVREQIEVFEGRIRLYDDQVALATLTLQVSTRPGPLPAKPPAPTLGSQISDTFSGSWGALRAAGRGTLLTVVAVLPWAPFAFAFAAGALWLRRRARRARRVTV